MPNHRFQVTVDDSVDRDLLHDTLNTALDGLRPTLGSREVWDRTADPDGHVTVTVEVSTGDGLSVGAVVGAALGALVDTGDTATVHARIDFDYA